jgi:uncharacterized protein with GYD domain
MPLFIRLARLTEKGHQNIQNMQSMLSEAEKIMDANGTRILHSYLILGEYDVVSVIEAPDERTAAKISALIANLGYFRAETLPAIPMEEFISSLNTQER